MPRHTRESQRNMAPRRGKKRHGAEVGAVPKGIGPPIGTCALCKTPNRILKLAGHTICTRKQCKDANPMRRVKKQKQPTLTMLVPYSILGYRTYDPEPAPVNTASLFTPLPKEKIHEFWVDGRFKTNAKEQKGGLGIHTREWVTLDFLLEWCHEKRDPGLLWEILMDKVEDCVLQPLQKIYHNQQVPWSPLLPSEQ